MSSGWRRSSRRSATGLSASADRADPRICLLTPGPFSETYFEHAYLARYLGFLLVEGDDLVVGDGRVHVRTIAGLKRADVICAGSMPISLDPLELNAASRLGVPGLMDAIREGGVVVPTCRAPACWKRRRCSASCRSLAGACSAKS